MKQKNYSIEINASVEKVWFVLWNDIYYKMWTSAFCEGSTVETDWNEGSKVHFLSPSGDGMYSLITKNTANQQMYFTHIGNIENFKEVEPNEESNAWTGAREYYTVSEVNGKTVLEVLMDITEDHEEYFDIAFPKGLALVKNYAENFFILAKQKVNKSVSDVWNFWTNPEAIQCWNAANDDWHTTKASIDLQKNGQFSYRMEAKDGSFGFDFNGIFDEVILHEKISYHLEDDRKVNIEFKKLDNETEIVESFEAENTHSYDLQYSGWQAILNNFKKQIEQT